MLVTTVTGLHSKLAPGDVLIVNAPGDSQDEADSLAYLISAQLASVTSVRLHAPQGSSFGHTEGPDQVGESNDGRNTLTVDLETTKIADVHAELAHNSVPVVVSIPGLEFDTIPPLRNGKHENLFISMLRAAAKLGETYAICVTTSTLGADDDMPQGRYKSLLTTPNDPDTTIILNLDN